MDSAVCGEEVPRVGLVPYRKRKLRPPGGVSLSTKVRQNRQVHPDRGFKGTLEEALAWELQMEGRPSPTWELRLWARATAQSTSTALQNPPWLPTAHTSKCRARSRSQICHD